MFLGMMARNNRNSSCAIQIMSKKNYSELQYISTHSDKGGSFMKQMSEYKERQPKE